MAEFKVEKGVPVPDAPRHTGTKYPWPDMQHGDSVLVPWTERDRERKRKGQSTGIVPIAYDWLRRNRPGWTSVSRTEGEATRIWFLDPNANGAPES
jgi:hypothetical protein